MDAYTVVVHDNFTDEETSDPPALLNLPPMPVVSLTGLAALLGGCLLAGASILRRKR